MKLWEKSVGLFKQPVADVLIGIGGSPGVVSVGIEDLLGGPDLGFVLDTGGFHAGGGLLIEHEVDLGIALGVGQIDAAAQRSQSGVVVTAIPVLTCS